MAVFVVTWNLNKERSNYAEARRIFIQHLERYPNCKDDGLESVRWISAASTAQQVSQDLLQKLDKNDRLFVSKLNPDQYHGYLNKPVWNWISQRL